MATPLYRRVLQFASKYAVRLLISVVAVVAIVCALVTWGDTASLTASASDWCPTLTDHDVDCGVITRPLVAGQPQLGTIEIGYALVHHSGPDATPAGTIMPNPGGPGLPTIAFGTDVAALPDDMLDDYDMLLIDPRGTGVSTPMQCGVDQRDFETGSRDDQRTAVADCAADLGARAAGYTSAATADDFDAVRAHLGINKVIAYGSSYGTYLMTVYAQRHPHRVQSVILAGAYPLDFDPLQRPNAEAVDLALQRICERSGQCDGDIAVDDLHTVAAQLRDNPIPLGRVDLTEGEFANLVFERATSGVGGDPDSMTPLGELPAALHAAVNGDDEQLQALMLDLLGDDDDGGGDGDDLYVAVSCNDYVTLWSPDADPATRQAQYQAALADAGDLGAFSASGFAQAQHDGGDVCIDWPAGGAQRLDATQHPLPAVPVLVLSGDLDAVTPDENGLRAARQFPQSTFLEVPNLGHTPDNEPSGCVANIIGTFIRNGATGDSTQCLDDIPAIDVEPVP